MDAGRPMATKQAQQGAEGDETGCRCARSPHARIAGHESAAADQPHALGGRRRRRRRRRTRAGCSRWTARTPQAGPEDEVAGEVWMSAAMRGRAVVRIPVPETLMKVTPVRTRMMEKASRAVFSSFLSTEMLSDGMSWPGGPCLWRSFRRVSGIRGGLFVKWHNK